MYLHSRTRLHCVVRQEAQGEFYIYIFYIYLHLQSILCLFFFSHRLRTRHLYIRHSIPKKRCPCMYNVRIWRSAGTPPLSILSVTETLYHQLTELHWFTTRSIGSAAETRIHVVRYKTYFSDVLYKVLVDINFMFTPCINNIQHFIFQLMHTTLKKQSY